jgi:4-amino-4-deoxy-L-arabinose transferase-like glycosyltransferase
VAVPITVAVVALALRWNAIPLLPVESDDAIYMNVAQHYAQDMSSGNWTDLVRYDGETGHPPFYELAFASSLVVRDALGIPFSDVETMRVLAALLGAAQAGLVALLNPLAGWFVAIQTTEIKFTSMAYLEALPALAMAASVLSYERFRRTSQPRWLYISAVGLGLTAASKFIYLAGGFAIAAFLLWEQRKRPSRIVAFGIVSLAVFALASPYFWTDPIGRLEGMFAFHFENSTRSFVQQLDRPWWYLWVVLANPGMIYSPPYEHPAFYVIVWDRLIYILGLLGLPSLARRSWLYLAWFVAGMIFLALWEAKWEQYAMIIAAPLCLAAGYFVLDAAKWLRAAFNSRRPAVQAAQPGA